MKTAPLLTLLAALAAPALAQPETPHILLDRDLNPSHVRVVSISRDLITVRAQDSSVRKVPTAQVLALFLSPRVGARGPSGGTASSHWLSLADGRRLRGQVQLPAEPAPGELVFGSIALGPISLKMDDISSLILRKGAAAPHSDSADSLLLANGDTVEGFVESFGERVTISPTDPNAQPLSLPAENIAALSLANPPTRGSGAIVWTTDETLAYESISLAPSGACTLRLLTPTGETRDYQTDAPSLNAIITDVSSVVALSDLTVLSATTTGNRKWSPSPITRTELGASINEDIEISGPARVEWTLPQGATRLAGLAKLPESCRDWGDLTFTLRLGTSDGAPAFTARLNRANPEAEFNVRIPLGTETLTAEIDPGPDGPIQDRVRLARTLLLAPAPSGDK